MKKSNSLHLSIISSPKTPSPKVRGETLSAVWKRGENEVKSDEFALTATYILTVRLCSMTFSGSAFSQGREVENGRNEK